MAQALASGKALQSKEPRAKPPTITAFSLTVPRAALFQPVLAPVPALGLPVAPEDQEPEFDHEAMARDAANPVTATVPGANPEGEGSPPDSSLSSARSVSLLSFPPSPDGESQAEDRPKSPDFPDTPSPRSDADDIPLFDEEAMRRNTNLALNEYGLEASAEPNVPVNESNNVPHLPKVTANPAVDSHSDAVGPPVASGAAKFAPSNADFDVNELRACLRGHRASNPSQAMDRNSDPASLAHPLDEPDVTPVPSNEPANAPNGSSDDVASKDAPTSPISDDFNISLGSFHEERDLEPVVGPDPGITHSTPSELEPFENLDEWLSKHFPEMLIPTDDVSNGEEMFGLAGWSNPNLTPPSASGDVFVSGPMAALVPSEDHAMTSDRSLETRHQIANEAMANTTREIEELKEQHRQELQEREAQFESWKAKLIDEGRGEIAKREAGAQQEAQATLEATLAKEKAQLEKDFRAEFDTAIAGQKQEWDNSLAQVREHAFGIQAEFAGLQRKIVEQEQMLASKDTMMKDKEAEITKQKYDLARKADLLAKKDRIFESSRADYVKHSEEREQSKAEAELVENQLRSRISELEEEQKASIMDKKNAEIEKLKSTIERTSASYQDFTSIQEEITVAKMELKKLNDQQAGLVADLDKLEKSLKAKERRTVSLETQNRELEQTRMSLETQNLELTRLVKNVDLKDLEIEADEIKKRHSLPTVTEAEEDGGKDGVANGGSDNGQKRDGKGMFRTNRQGGPALSPVAGQKEITTRKELDCLSEKDLELGPIPPKWFTDDAIVIAEPVQPIDETAVKEKSVFPTWWIFGLILLAIVFGWGIMALAGREAPIMIDRWKLSVWSYHAGDGCGMSVPGWLWVEPQLELSGTFYG